MYLTGAKTPTGKHATGAASTVLAPHVMFPSSLKTRLFLEVLLSHRAYWRPTQGSMFTFPGTGKKKMLFSPMETENSQMVKIALLSLTGDSVGREGRRAPSGSPGSGSPHRAIPGITPLRNRRGIPSVACRLTSYAGEREVSRPPEAVMAHPPKSPISPMGIG